jgi:cytohesin
MPLLSIPNELLLEISTYIGPRDLSHLICNHRLRDLFTPLLHQYALQDWSHDSALHWAARRGHVPLIKLILSKGLDVNLPNSCGDTPLHFAARDGHLGAVSELLANGADMNVREKCRGATALVYAVEGGYRDISELLIDKGADVYTRLDDGSTLLHCVHKYPRSFAHLESRQLLRVLLSKGISTSHCIEATGRTPLHAAVYYRIFSTVKTLLDAGAAVNVQDRLGNTPLIQLLEPPSPFAQTRPINRKLFKLLLKYGADVNIHGADGCTALHRAIELRGQHNFFWRPPTVVRALLRHGADIRARDREGETPLHVAAAVGTPKIIRILLRHKAPLDERTSSGRTPLECACHAGEASNAELLVRRGAGLRWSTFNGYSILHYAVFHNWSVRVLKALLKEGAETNVVDLDGDTPLSLAEKLARTRLVTVLRTDTFGRRWGIEIRGFTIFEVCFDVGLFL